MRQGLSFAALLTGAVAFGCSSGGSNTPTGPVGGAISGASDTHCAPAGGPATVQTVGACVTTADQVPANSAMCSVTFDTSGAPAGGDGGVATVNYGDTMYNSAGDDDDCKYHISWTSTPIRLNTNVTFTVTVTTLSDGEPVSCGGVRAELFLGDTHAIPSPPQGTESPTGSGVYKVGPVKFDMPSTAATPWTVRFHLFEECSDAPVDSPHGHAAFFVDVPAPGADGGAG